MFSILVVFCCFFAINGQLLEEAHPAPEPYSFAFSSPNEDGTSSSREETGDANGRITGSYTILGADGQQRRVEYVADENGFRANVITNEIGTESQNAADAQVLSSAPTAAELTAQWEASGAGRARLAGAGVLRAPAPAFRAPIGGPGLIAAPIAPIGGGIAGAQALRVGQGIRVGAAIGPVAAPLPRPVVASNLRVSAPFPAPVAAPLPAPVAVQQIAPIPAPVPALAFGGVRVAGAVGGPLVNGGFSRAQVIRGQQLNGVGIIGTGVSPFGVRVAPLGGFETVRAFGGAVGPVQNLQGLRGVNVGHLPVGTGGNLFLLQSGNALQNPYLSGVSNVGPLSQQTLLATESYKTEGYECGKGRHGPRR